METKRRRGVKNETHVGLVKESKCMREPHGGFSKVAMDLIIESDCVQAKGRVA